MVGLKVAKPMSRFLKSAISCGERSNPASDHILEYYSNNFAFRGYLSRHGNLLQIDNNGPKSVHTPRIKLSYIIFSKITLLHTFPLGYLSVWCSWPSGILTFLSAPCTWPCRPKHQISVHFASGLWPDFQNICLFWDPTFEPYVGGPPFGGSQVLHNSACACSRDPGVRGLNLVYL